MKTEWIKIALAVNGISARQLAARIGLDPASTSRVLSGKRRMQLDEAITIANLLGVDINTFANNCGIYQASSINPLDLQAENARLKEMVRNLSQMI